jgi:hypothetical protein
VSHLQLQLQSFHAAVVVLVVVVGTLTPMLFLPAQARQGAGLGLGQWVGLYLTQPTSHAPPLPQAACGTVSAAARVMDAAVAAAAVGCGALVPVLARLGAGPAGGACLGGDRTAQVAPVCCQALVSASVASALGADSWSGTSGAPLCEVHVTLASLPFLDLPVADAVELREVHSFPTHTAAPTITVSERMHGKLVCACVCVCLCQLPPFLPDVDARLLNCALRRRCCLAPSPWPPVTVSARQPLRR